MELPLRHWLLLWENTRRQHRSSKTLSTGWPSQECLVAIIKLNGTHFDLNNCTLYDKFKPHRTNYTVRDCRCTVRYRFYGGQWRYTPTYGCSNMCAFAIWVILASPPSAHFLPRTFCCLLCMLVIMTVMWERCYPSSLYGLSDPIAYECIGKSMTRNRAMCVYQMVLSTNDDQDTHHMAISNLSYWPWDVELSKRITYYDVEHIRCAQNLTDVLIIL